MGKVNQLKYTGNSRNLENLKLMHHTTPDTTSISRGDFRKRQEEIFLNWWHIFSRFAPRSGAESRGSYVCRILSREQGDSLLRLVLLHFPGSGALLLVVSVYTGRRVGPMVHKTENLKQDRSCMVELEFFFPYFPPINLCLGEGGIKNKSKNRVLPIFWAR